MKWLVYNWPIHSVLSCFYFKKDEILVVVLRVPRYKTVQFTYASRLKAVGMKFKRSMRSFYSFPRICLVFNCGSKVIPVPWIFQRMPPVCRPWCKCKWLSQPGRRSLPLWMPHKTASYLPAFGTRSLDHAF